MPATSNPAPMTRNTSATMRSSDWRILNVSKSVTGLLYSLIRIVSGNQAVLTALQVCVCIVTPLVGIQSSVMSRFQTCAPR